MVWFYKNISQHLTSKHLNTINTNIKMNCEEQKNEDSDDDSDDEDWIREFTTELEGQMETVSKPAPQPIEEDEEDSDDEWTDVVTEEEMEVETISKQAPEPTPQPIGECYGPLDKYETKRKEYENGPVSYSSYFIGAQIYKMRKEDEKQLKHEKWVASLSPEALATYHEDEEKNRLKQLQENMIEAKIIKCRAVLKKHRKIDEGRCINRNRHQLDLPLF